MYFGVLGLPQMLDAVQPIYQDEIELLRGAMQVPEDHQFKEALEAELEAKLEPRINELEAKMKRTLFHIKNRILKIEGSVVIAGTIIWGFGDFLVPKLGSFCG